MPKPPLTLLLPLLLLATPALAQDPAPPPMWPVQQFQALLATPEPTPESRANTARLIRDLTADNYQTREAASQELAAKGPAAFPGLREAVAASTDPELHARTSQYFASGHFLIPSGIPLPVADLVQKYEKARQGYIDRGVPPSLPIPSISSLEGSGQLILFYSLLLQQEQNPDLRNLLQQSLQSYPALQARMLIASGKLDDAEQVLRRALDRRDIAVDYATLVALRRGPALDPEKEINDIPAGLSEQTRIQLAILFYRAKGDLAHAAVFATKLQDNYAAPARMLLIQTGRFDDLASFAKTVRYGVETDPLIVARLQNHDEMIQKLLDRADNEAGPDAGTYGGPNAVQNHRNFSALNSFLLADRAQTAIDISKERKDGRDIAFHLLCQQLRIREALAAIPDRKSAPPEMARQLSDIGLQAAARQLLFDSKPQSIQLDSNASYGASFHYAAELDHAGAHREAAEWRSRVFPLVDPYTDQLQSIRLQRVQLEHLRQDLENQLTMISPAQTPDRLAQSKRADLVSEISRISVKESSLLQQEERRLSHMLGFASLWHHPDLPDETAWRDASWWYENVLWEEILPASDRFEKAIRLAVGKLSDDETKQFIAECLSFVPPNYAPIQRVALSARWSAALHRMNRDADAVTLVNQLVTRDRDPIYFSLLGDLALDRGDPETAVKYYRQAAVTNPIDPTLMYRLGIALSRQPQTAEAGRQLIATAPLLTLGDHYQPQYLADTMRHFEGETQANKWLDSYVSHFMGYIDSDYGAVIARARNAALAQGDYALALKLQTQALFEPQITGDFSPVMANIALYHKCRALDALTRKDFPTLADALDRHLSNAAPDIDLLEKTLPALRAANPAAAQKILSRALNRLKPITEDYPEATQYQLQLTRLQSLSH